MERPDLITLYSAEKKETGGIITTFQGPTLANNHANTIRVGLIVQLLNQSPPNFAMW